jgi:hypothetical protein
LRREDRELAHNPSTGSAASLPLRRSRPDFEQEAAEVAERAGFEQEAAEIAEVFHRRKQRQQRPCHGKKQKQQRFFPFNLCYLCYLL